jgi:hypothetical protein
MSDSFSIKNGLKQGDQLLGYDDDDDDDDDDDNLLGNNIKKNRNFN